MARRYFGIDFGTTNSAISMCGPQGPAQIVAVQHNGREFETFRSVLFYELEEKFKAKRLLTFAGPAAIDAYELADGAGGRFIQSIKSYLADPHFSQTSVFGTSRALEDLIADILQRLIRAAEDIVGPIDGPVTVGRPARFVGDSPIERLALDRLTRAYNRAGLKDISFEYEPVGAAYHVEQQLNRDALVLIGDFGGGTSDFCVLRIGPQARARHNRAADILSVGGIGLAGDAFDARMIDHAIAPGLGRDALYRGQTGQFLPMPKWIYGEIARWHRLAFLDRPETRALFREVSATITESDALEGLKALIHDHRGFALSKSVEAAKIALSSDESCILSFDSGPAKIRRKISRDLFNRWISPDLDAIDGVVEDVLSRAQLAPDQIDRVFLTGGSSRLVGLRARFENRFGIDKIAQADALSAVANGLALSARDQAESP